VARTGGVTLCACLWAQSVATHSPWRHRARFGLPQPSAMGLMPFGELRLGLQLPPTGPLNFPCLGFPANPPGLGAQVMPVSLALSPQCSGTTFPHRVLLGEGSPLWELCGGLAACPCVPLLLPWGQEGGPGKAQGNSANTICPSAAPSWPWGCLVSPEFGSPPCSEKGGGSSWGW